MKAKLSKQKIIDSYMGGLINYGISSLKFLNPLKYHINYYPNTIIIYKLDAIGDSILLLPMIKHLKEQTNAKIIVACSNSNIEIFKYHSFIDKIIKFNSSKLDIGEIMFNINKLKDKKADLTIDCAQSANISAIFSWLTAKHTIGFKKTKGTSRNKVYNYTIDIDPNKHMVLNYFDLLKPLDITPPKEIKLVKLPIINKMKKTDVIGIHPCNIFPYKTWPIDRWVKIIEYLAQDNLVFIIGSKEETPLVKILLSKINKKYKGNISNTSGNLSIRQLIDITQRFKLFIGMDGGPMHISASMNIPTIGLFGHETPIRYAPFNKNSIAIYKQLFCNPCVKAYDKKIPDCEDPTCLEDITVKEVIKSINKLK